LPLPRLWEWGISCKNWNSLYTNHNFS
jgi:hypothetical protein